MSKKNGAEVPSEFDTKISMLEKLIASGPWQSMRGHLTMQLNGDIVALVNPNPERKQSDDFLRGRISLLKWLLEGLPQELKEARFEQMRERVAAGGQPPDLGDPYAKQQE